MSDRIGYTFKAMGKVRLNKRQRDKVMPRFGRECHICGLPTFKHLPMAHPARFTIDHVKPWSKGGSRRLENLRPACGYCNQAKADEVAVACVRTYRIPLA